MAMRAFHSILTLRGSNGLKRDNLLLDLDAFTFWAPEFCFFIFRDTQLESKFLIAFFTSEIITGHCKPPVINICFTKGIHVNR
jgi:hypothetical protein